MSKDDMQIIVVEKNILFGNENYFEGFRNHKEKDYESIIVDNLKIMRRGDAEIDPNHKQPIGYILIVNPKTKRIFAYQRSSKDKEYDEKRLQGKWSWGIGGHIEPSDNTKGNFLRNSVLRELEEEAEIIGEILGSKVLGYINYDSDDVSKVHFGILYLVEVDGDVKPKDLELSRGELISLNDLENILSNENVIVEAWSKIAIEPLKNYLNKK